MEGQDKGLDEFLVVENEFIGIEIRLIQADEREIIEAAQESGQEAADIQQYQQRYRRRQ